MFYEEPRDDSWYDTAQICLKGHVINSTIKDNPKSNQDYCDKCGEATITQCPSCNQEIRGKLHVPGVIAPSGKTAPNYCLKCGNPFPWTQRSIEATQAIIAELEELDEDERHKLSKSLEDLVRETPNTELAKTRYKKIGQKLGEESYSILKESLKKIVTESVRKALFGV